MTQYRIRIWKRDNLARESVSFAVVAGKRVILKGYEKLQLFIHLQQGDGVWHISEAQTGRWIASGKTKAETRKKAIAFLSGYTLEEIEAIVRKQMHLAEPLNPAFPKGVEDMGASEPAAT